MSFSPGGKRHSITGEKGADESLCLISACLMHHA